MCLSTLYTPLLGACVLLTPLPPLQEVSVSVVSGAACEAALRRTRLGPRYVLHPGMLCAGGEAGKDACKVGVFSPAVYLLCSCCFSSIHSSCGPFPSGYSITVLRPLLVIVVFPPPTHLWRNSPIHICSVPPVHTPFTSAVLFLHLASHPLHAATFMVMVMVADMCVAE